MVVLGIDTTTWTAAVGLVRDDTVLAERTARTTRSYAGSLATLVDGVLADAGLQVAMLDAVAVSIGPGSFTGLRVSLGFAKGMAFAGGQRLAAVSTLEALAQVADAPVGATVCAALDARKREVYAAQFRVTPDGVTRLTPDAAWAPAALLATIAPGTIVVGDASDVYPQAFPADSVIRPFTTYHPRGGTVARLGVRRLLAGYTDDPGALEPAYVRASEAELLARSEGIPKPA